MAIFNEQPVTKIIGAEDLGFDSRAGQIELSVAKGSPPLRRFFGAEAQALSRGDGLRHSLHALV